MSEIIARRAGAVAHLSLNRPAALNALTLAMCEALSDALLAWRADPAVEAVILDHHTGRGFCAGGDVAAIRRSALEDGGTQGRAFFHAEYRLNHLLQTYPKPVIAFMDGVTMGGGVGLALPCRYRVATENTLFAMPEGAIGLFPDIGAGWYLPRLPGRLGQFLALTGARFDGAECLWSGLATHYLPAEALAEVKTAIAETPGAIADVLARHAAPPPAARVEANAARIAQLFASDQLEDVLAALAADPSEWAAKEHAAVAKKCPTSAKVALRQMATAPADFTDEMVREYALAAHLMMRGDFAEGVRAVLVDKDHAPRWDPAQPEDMTEAALDAIFAPLADDEAWTPFPA